MGHRGQERPALINLVVLVLVVSVLIDLTVFLLMILSVYQCPMYKFS